jgi:hypothetical protein
MSHLEKFLEYARNELGEISQEDLYSGPDSLDEVDRILYEYGQYVLNIVREIDSEVDADTSNDIDYAEHKNHWLQFYSDVQIGGKMYRVILMENEYLYGKIAEDPQDFHNCAVADIRNLIRHYHHVQNHVEGNLNDGYYNTGDDLRGETSSLDNYSG